jgi:hypothetical protein
MGAVFGEQEVLGEVRGKGVGGSSGRRVGRGVESGLGKN